VYEIAEVEGRGPGAGAGIGAGAGAVVDTHDDDEGDATGEVVPVEHIVQLVAAATAAYCPTAQAAHEVEPVVDAKVPTTQFVQLIIANVTENFPGEHITQVPAVVAYWPAAQDKPGAGAGEGAEAGMGADAMAPTSESAPE